MDNNGKQIALSKVELAAAFAAAGLTPAPYSAVSTLAPALRPEALNSLRSKQILDSAGAVSAQWRPALAALANPDLRVHLLLGDVARSASADYFLGAGGTCVAYTDNGSETVISAPTPAQAAKAILDMSAAWLGYGGLREPEPFHALLTPPELTVLAAIVDAYRETQIRQLLERAGPAEAQVPGPLVSRCLEVGLTRQDLRWLVSLLAVSAPAAFAPQSAHLSAGVRALMSRRWIRLAGNDVFLQGEIVQACREFANTVPFLLFGAGEARGQAFFVLACRALSTLATIHFETNNGGAPGARVLLMGGQLFPKLLESRLSLLTGGAAAGTLLPSPTARQAPLRPAPSRGKSARSKEPPSATSVPGLQCKKCGQVNPQGMTFCGRCASRLLPEKPGAPPK